MKGSPTLPLGAVRAADGSVVVPESRRADGSVRKPIRIRQGYVPQDEVPKYKPIGQRMREQDAKQRKDVEAGGTDADAIADSLGGLSLRSDAKPSADAKPTPEPRPRPTSPTPTPARSERAAATASIKELKTELSGINKALREITKLEGFASAFARGDEGSRPLSAAQSRKLERRASLEARRLEIIAVLDAEAKPASSTSDTKPRTLRVIEL